MVNSEWVWFAMGWIKVCKGKMRAREGAFQEGCEQAVVFVSCRENRVAGEQCLRRKRRRDPRNRCHEVLVSRHR